MVRVNIDFDECVGLLGNAEWLARENTRLARALHEAKLKLPQASVGPLRSRSPIDAFK